MFKKLWRSSSFNARRFALWGMSVASIAACSIQLEAGVGGGPDSGAPREDASVYRADGGGEATDARPDVDPDAPGSIQVAVRFGAKVGTEAFACGKTYSQLGSTGASLAAADMRFFVQDLRLIDDQNALVPVRLDTRDPWQTPEVALLDFENGTGGCMFGTPEMNDIVTGSVPSGHRYVGVVFTNGVPTSLNHKDPATLPAPLAAGGMSWNWLMGFIFIKAEMNGVSDAGFRTKGLFHLGSVACSPSFDAGVEPCRQPNRNVIRLAPFDVARNVVVLDMKTLFSSTDLSTTRQCHSGGAEVCSPLFANVGLEFDGGATLPTHPAFRVE